MAKKKSKQTKRAAGASEEIAVLVPCYNEEVTVEKVVGDFRKALPTATIYVYDNNSSDRTAELAAKAGAIVRPAPRQGKGFAMRQMFEEIDADLYVLVDGDDTYPAEEAPGLIEKLKSSGADMVVGSRLSEFEDASFRKFHQFGNHILTGFVSFLFRSKVTDMLSGYRVFTYRFVKSIPLESGGFEIETELTLQAVAKGFHIVESPIYYRKRPEGSYSKLNTWSDGLLVLKSIFIIFRYFKPMLFFGIIAAGLSVLSLLAGFRPVIEFVNEGYVHTVPSAILASGIGVLAMLSLAVGMILDTVLRMHNENFMTMSKLIRMARSGRE